MQYGGRSARPASDQHGSEIVKRLRDCGQKVRALVRASSDPQRVAALEKAGAEQFIFVSVDTSRVPDSPLRTAKSEVEEYLKRSGLTYTILHPSAFMEVWLGPMLFADTAAGTAKVYGEGTHKIRYVATADVAELAVQCVGNPAALNAVIPFGGPEPVSQRDAVKLFEEEFGKPFVVTEIPEPALEAQWC